MTPKKAIRFDRSYKLQFLPRKQKNVFVRICRPRHLLATHFLITLAAIYSSEAAIATMCVLCHATRKSRSLSKMITSAHRSITSSTAATAETSSFNFISIRPYSAAVPQPADNSTNTRVDGYVLHPSTINSNILKAQYAVRGELYNKAVELAQQGREITYTNGTLVVV